MSEFFTPERDKLGLRQPGPMRDDLPNVFLIGDSISIGYTPGVQAELQSVCNVHRPETNCGDTRRGLSDLQDWLGDTPWDVIHFNFGLHDLCYRNPKATVYGNRDKANGVISVPLKEYQVNLETLVQRLKTACPKLIWASTTRVPEGEPGRFQGDEIRYNTAAAEVMQGHEIPINDLHALTSHMDPSLFSGPDDVHYTEAGSQRLAEQVASAIQCELKRGSSH